MKKLLTILTGILLVLSLVACGGGDSNGKSNGTKTADTKKEKVKEDSSKEFMGKWIQFGYEDKDGLDYYGRGNYEEKELFIIEVNDAKKAKFTDLGEEPYECDYKIVDGAMVVDELDIKLSLKDGMLVETDNTDIIQYYYKEGTDPSKGEKEIEARGEKVF